jgi:hypothetical protein
MGKMKKKVIWKFNKFKIKLIKADEFRINVVQPLLILQETKQLKSYN